MHITRNLNNGAYDVTLSGRFTFSDHGEFRRVLEQISEADVQHVVFHMANVDFVDSAALGMLLLANDEARKHNKHLAISGVSDYVKKIFDMAKFDTIFAIN